MIKQQENKSQTKKSYAKNYEFIVKNIQNEILNLCWVSMIKFMIRQRSGQHSSLGAKNPNQVLGKQHRNRREFFFNVQFIYIADIYSITPLYSCICSWCVLLQNPLFSLKSQNKSLQPHWETVLKTLFQSSLSSCTEIVTSLIRNDTYNFNRWHSKQTEI